MSGGWSGFEGSFEGGSLWRNLTLAKANQLAGMAALRKNQYLIAYPSMEKKLYTFFRLEGFCALHALHGTRVGLDQIKAKVASTPKLADFDADF